MQASFWVMSRMGSAGRGPYSLIFWHNIFPVGCLDTENLSLNRVQTGNSSQEHQTKDREFYALKLRAVLSEIVPFPVVNWLGWKRMENGISGRVGGYTSEHLMQISFAFRNFPYFGGVRSPSSVGRLLRLWASPIKNCRRIRSRGRWRRHEADHSLAGAKNERS